jgi:hypothetical protein
MGKEENLQNLENPFQAFSVLKGDFNIGASNENADDDIKTGTEGLIEDTLDNQDDNLENDAIKKADKALEEIADKQKKAIKKEEVVDDTTEDVDDTQKVEEDEEPKESTGISEFTKALYEKNVLDFDDTDEDFEDSEEGLEKLINKTVNNRINKWAESLPEDYAKFLDYVQNGGDPKQFINTYYNTESWENFNLESEDNQKRAIKESLKLAGESPEDINDMIDEWEINGSLEKRAKSAITKLQKHEKAEKEKIVEYQKEQARKQEATNLEYWNNFKKDLYERETVAGFKLTPKVKDNLWNFMTQVDKSGKTAYEKAIESNKESSYLFAYLAMNNFDSKKLEKQVETKVSNKLSGVLKNYSKDTKSKISSGTSDDNYDNNPFSGFRKIK